MAAIVLLFWQLRPGKKESPSKFTEDNICLKIQKTFDHHRNIL